MRFMKQDYPGCRNASPVRWYDLNEGGAACAGTTTAGQASATCVMRTIPIVSLLCPALLAACAHQGRVPTAFTDEWTQQNRKQAAFEERQARIKSDELVLVGNKDKARAAVRVDEKGKPRINIGKRKGLSADVDVGSDEADVKLKYKFEW